MRTTADMAGRAGWFFISCVLSVLFACGMVMGAESSPKKFQNYIPAEKNLSAEWVRQLSERGSRAVFRGNDLDTIGMPIGGIAAGELYLRGDGTLGQWRIFNKYIMTGCGQNCYRTYRPESPVDSGFAVAVVADGRTQVKRLNRDDFPAVEFLGEYPIGLVRYADKGFPVKIEMEAFSPFIPLSAKDSALPATLFHLTIENVSGKRLRASVVGWLENAVCFNSAKNILANRRTRIIQEKNRTLVVHTVEERSVSQEKPTIKPYKEKASSIEKLPDFGSLTLALAEPQGAAGALLSRAGDWAGKLNTETDRVYPSSERRSTALTSPTIELEPGGKRTFTFVLAWFFPNELPGTFTHGPRGREYGNRFKSARAVAHYVLDRHERLAGQTRLWHKTFYEDSTLPRWLLFRLHSTVGNLATETCQWWDNGRFWAWEGEGCCAGTCTHVWDYAHAHARLFPEIARNIREMQDFGAAFDERTGLVHYRADAKDAGDCLYAADGQCGTVLNAYREHRTSPDYAFLKRNWPRIKKALQYPMYWDGRDGEDGILHGEQHNTYDIQFWGPNTYVGSLYLAALCAGEAMAQEMGDQPFAARCRRLFESGRKLTVEKQWNSEYFIQLVDPRHPKYQYGQGCHSNQLFGQGWAHEVDLGYIYPAENVRTALRSVWKYNWTPDVGPYYAVHKPFRWFARSGEAGLINCTWPKIPYPKDGVLYSEEVQTGTEYQVAADMAWEGMVTEALAICCGVHDRYHPSKHNPFNEVECGDHYARAMASWGVYTALTGFEYHGPKGYLEFAPRFKPENHKAAFTAAEGWGSFTQKREAKAQYERIEVRWGTVRIRTLAFAVPEHMNDCRIEVTVDGRPVKVTGVMHKGRLVIKLNERIDLNEGQALEAVIR
jgi:non-lysosomal glucosylceramidase